jgi:hypothetical protein
MSFMPQPTNQDGHHFYGQVGPFKRSWFVIVTVKHKEGQQTLKTNMHKLFSTHKIKHYEMFNFHLQKNEGKNMIKQCICQQYMFRWGKKSWLLKAF